MATKRQIEEQDIASDTRRNAACAEIVNHAAHDGDMFDDVMRKGLALDVFSALVEAVEGERDDITELRRKGWQSRAREHDAAIVVIKEWRDGLAGYTPAAGMPTREPLAEIAVSHRADTPAELDARLEAAFAIPPPVRHIRTALETSIPHPMDSFGNPTYGALCGGTDGSWTYRGGANCPTCIATYDAEHGPHTGPTAFSDATGGITLDLSGVDPNATGMDESAAERLAALPDATGELHPPAPAIGLPHPRMTMNDTLQWPREADGSPSPGTAADVAALNIVEPTGPVVRPRMSAAQVREHGLARQRGAEHRSVSQVESFGDCGTRAALSDLERPAWWNVGGKALHACVEEINRWVADGGTLAHPIPSEERWLRHFDAQIAEQCAATPDHPMSTWRAAKKGSEHYDFWRVEGPIMVQRWVTWLTRMLANGWTIARSIDFHARSAELVPVIEYETHLDVGIPVPNLSIIDLALLHQQRNTLLIVDAKAGGSAPKDTFQLGVYGWSLVAAGVAGFTPTPDLSNVRGAYWRARTGETHVANLPILTMHPWPDVVQRYRDMDVMERQGVYMPNVTSFCGGCGVRDLCPAQASA